MNADGLRHVSTLGHMHRRECIAGSLSSPSAGLEVVLGSATDLLRPQSAGQYDSMRSALEEALSGFANCVVHVRCFAVSILVERTLIPPALIVPALTRCLEKALDSRFHETACYALSPDDLDEVAHRNRMRAEADAAWSLACEHLPFIARKMASVFELKSMLRDHWAAADVARIEGLRISVRQPVRHCLPNTIQQQQVAA